MSIADLEIGLHRRDEGAYAVELRFNLPADAAENAAEINPITGDDVQISFDFEALRALKSQPAVYGKSLSDSLFAGPIASAFASARAVAASAFSPLRLRLFIGPERAGAAQPGLGNAARPRPPDPAPQRRKHHLLALPQQRGLAARHAAPQTRPAGVGGRRQPQRSGPVSPGRGGR